MPAGYTTVSAAHLTDATGLLVASATIGFQPCDSQGAPLSFRVNGAGQSMSQQVTAQVIAGVFSIVLADTTLTIPINICYAVTVTDNVSGQSLLGPGYLIQPSGSTWSLDSFVPLVAPLGIINTGPAGPAGPTGAVGATGPTGPAGASLNYRGAWSSVVAYALNDAVSVSSVLYASLQGTNLNQNPTTATTFWAVFPSPTLSATTPIVASGSGSSGSAGTAAKGDHIHPSEVAGLAIAPLSVATGGVAVESATSTLNPQSGVRYFCDSAGNVWMYCDANGRAHFPIGLTIDSAVFNQAPTFPSAVINDESIQAIVSKWLGSSKVVTDSAGSVSLTVMPDGSLFTPQGIKGKFLAKVSTDSDGMVYYSQLDGATGLIQIFKADPLSGQTWQLTSNGNNYAPQISSDGTKLAFISDRTGVEQVFIGDLWAVVKANPNQDLRALFQYSHVAGTGQSLSIGYASSPLSTTQPYNNLTFNAGPRAAMTGGTAVLSASITSLIPLVEVSDVDAVAGPTTDGETICSGMLNRVAQDMIPQGILFVGIGSVSGEGAKSYTVIRKGAGNFVYANTLTEVTAAMALAVAAGKTYGVRACFLIHGEADELLGTTIYDQMVIQLQKNLNDDLKAITGQSTDIPLLFCQVSEWTSAAAGNVAIGKIAYAQLAAHEANPGKCILVGPKYHLPYAAVPHLSAAGYQRHGEYYGKVLQRVMGQGKAWRPLSPRSIQRNGAQILVTFWVPVQPLVIDTTTVTPPTYNTNGLNGFEYFDNSGSPPAISSVAVVSPTSVLVTLASVPTGSGNRIRYAYTGVVGQSAGSTAGTGGPRGCLRDSDASTSVYGYSMYNWCVHFDKAC